MLSGPLLVIAILAADGVGDPAAELAKLERQIAAKDWSAAAATARALEAAVAARAPLEIADAQVLLKPPEGLGMYTEIFEHRIPSTVDEVYLYAQVRNHGVVERAGFFHVHLVSDLIILDGDGSELARDEALGESRFGARVPHRDTLVVIALRTKGLSPGSYRARLVLHDRLGKQSAERDIPFTIVVR